MFSPFVHRNPLAPSADGGGFPILDFVGSDYGWALQGYFLGAGSTIAELYRTVDGGRTWQLLPEYLSGRYSGINFLDPNHGWVTFSYPLGYSPAFTLSQTHDGGLTWEHSEIPLPGDPNDYGSCRVGSPLMKTASGGEVLVSCGKALSPTERWRYETTDSGATWQLTPVERPFAAFVTANDAWILER